VRITQTLWQAIWPPLLFWAVFLLVLLVVLFWNVPGLRAAPQDAVVRLISHGGSATCISVGNGKSLLLSCAHCFSTRKDRDRQGRERPGPAPRYRPIVFDAPNPSPAAQLQPGVRVLKVDYQLDLSLLEVDAELPYVCPVAPQGHRLGQLLSVGYDEMCWPAKHVPTTVANWGGQAPNRLFTTSKPWHGRSGGGLLTGNYLVGVVSAYESNDDPSHPLPWTPRGVYVSHAAICRFLDWPATAPSQPLAGGADPFAVPQFAPQFAQPYLQERRDYLPPPHQLPPGYYGRQAQPCPGGT
jgi:Trypsin-like peptidase domain